MNHVQRWCWPVKRAGTGDHVVILFGGDCHFGDKPLRLDDHLRERIGQAEFVVVNQESPITEREGPAVDKEIHLRSSTEAARWLQNLGVEVVSIANNHIADYGEDGLIETIARLKSAGITPVGAGRDLSEAHSPAYVDLPDGRVIAFLAFTSRSIGSKIANERDYGCAELESAGIRRAIEQAREKASYVVLLLHYGLTKFDYPTPRERDVLRSFAGLGVNVIIGHHSHVVQGYEIFNGVPIFYSLGNLIFARFRQRGRVKAPAPESRKGALVAVAFSPRGTRIVDVIFTETTETEHHLSLGIPWSSIASARSFKRRSTPLSSSSYDAFFRRYAVQRLFRRLLSWTSPKRWRFFTGAQLKSLWLTVSYVVGRRR
jgi:poly-gamma-glutamate capsule biosynthesis protein CapA/YwtB (metallophosphatase superfamily)